MELLKNSFHCIKIELRETTLEKFPLVSIGITRVGHLFRKISVQSIFLFFVDMQDIVKEVLVLLQHLLEELQSLY